jgi:hypothetical protein
VKRILTCVSLFILVPALLAGCGSTAAPPATATAPPPTVEPPTPTPTTPPPTAAPPAEASPAPRPEGAFERYQSETLGFAIEQPQDWTVVERERVNTILFVVPDTGVEGEFRTNLSVGVHEAAPPLDALGAYTDAFLAQAPDQITDFRLLESEPALLDGRPAHRVVYTGSQTGMDLKWLQVWALDAGRAYIVTYTAEPDRYALHLPQTAYMISSLDIAPAPEASR